MRQLLQQKLAIESSTIYNMYKRLHSQPAVSLLSSTSNLLMPKSQPRKLVSTKRLTQINDLLVSGLGRVASVLQQKSKVLSSTSLQAALLSAVPIGCSKVLSQSLSLSYIALILMFEAQTKGHSG